MPLAAFSTPTYAMPERLTQRPIPKPVEQHSRTESAPATPKEKAISQAQKRLAALGIFVLSVAAAAGVVATAAVIYNAEKKKRASKASPDSAVDSTADTRPIRPQSQTTVETRPTPAVKNKKKGIPWGPILTAASLAGRLATASQAPIDNRVAVDLVPPTPVVIQGPTLSQQLPALIPPPVPAPERQASDTVAITTPPQSESTPTETTPAPPPQEAIAVPSFEPLPLPQPQPTESLVAPMLRPSIAEAAQLFSVPPALMHAILYTESRGALYESDIIGHNNNLVQMMPETLEKVVLANHDTLVQIAQQLGVDSARPDEQIRTDLSAIFNGTQQIDGQPDATIRMQMLAMAALLHQHLTNYPVVLDKPDTYLLAGLAYNTPSTAEETFHAMQAVLKSINTNFSSKSYDEQVQDSNLLLADILRAYYGLPPVNFPELTIVADASTSPEISERENNQPYTQLNLSVSVAVQGVEPVSLTLDNIQYLQQPKREDLPAGTRNANVGIGNNLVSEIGVEQG